MNIVITYLMLQWNLKHKAIVHLQFQTKNSSTNLISPMRPPFLLPYVLQKKITREHDRVLIFISCFLRTMGLVIIFPSFRIVQLDKIWNEQNIVHRWF